MAARIVLGRAAAPFLAASAAVAFTAPTTVRADSLSSNPRSSAATSSTVSPVDYHYQRPRKPIYDNAPALPSTVPASPPHRAADVESHRTTEQPKHSSWWSGSSSGSNSSSSSSVGTATPHTKTMSHASATTAMAPEHVAGPSPSQRLATQVRAARLALHGAVVVAEDATHSALSRVFSAERSVTETISSVSPRPESGERLIPGLVYVLVTAMAGSIVVRNRGILLRATAPLALGYAAARTFVPVTTRNVGDLVWSWEKQVPAVADAHEAAATGVNDAVRMANDGARAGKDWLEGSVKGVREALESWVNKGW